MKAPSLVFSRRWTLGLLLGLLVYGATAVHAAMVRGRLERLLPPGRLFPAAGVAVTVVNPQLGRSAPSYSDGSGMYYLYMPPGNYTLEIWISPDPRVRPILVPVRVVEPFVDIQPVRVP